MSDQKCWYIWSEVKPMVWNGTQLLLNIASIRLTECTERRDEEMERCREGSQEGRAEPVLALRHSTELFDWAINAINALNDCFIANDMFWKIYNLFEAIVKLLNGFLWAKTSIEWSLIARCVIKLYSQRNAWNQLKCLLLSIKMSLSEERTRLALSLPLPLLRSLSS